MPKRDYFEEKIRECYEKATGKYAPKRIEFTILLDFFLSEGVLCKHITKEEKDKLMNMSERFYNLCDRET